MIRLEGVSKYYNTDANVVLGLRRVSLELKLGEFVAITGESGSGKSTLLNVISGLDKYDEGELFVNGEETSYFSTEEFEQYRKQYIGFVFQNYNIIDSFTVYQNVMAALMIQGYDPKKRRARALELIDRVGLTSHKNHRASKLSGGQKQRAVIARALAKDCPIIVADEPTGNLDSETGKKVLELLKEVSKDKLVVIVTHNYEQVEPFATRKIRMFDGEIVEDKAIKAPQIIDNQPALASKNLNPLDVLKLALVSLFSIPKKTFLVFITLMFAFTAINSIYSVKEWLLSQNLSNNFNPIFLHNFEGRVIVVKEDASVFTQDELNTLLGKPKVESIIHHDILLQTEFYIHREGGLPSGILRPYYGQNITLETGRFPTAKNEIVVYDTFWGDTYEIGDTLTVYFQVNDRVFDGVTSGSKGYPMTVVGTIESGYHDYIGIVHPSFFNQTETNAIMTNNTMASFAVNLNEMWRPEMNHTTIEDSLGLYPIEKRSIIIDNQLPDGQAQVNNNFYTRLLELHTSLPEIQNETFILRKPANKFSGPKSISVQVIGASTLEYNYEYSIFMNEKMYNELYYEGPYQITLLAKDAYDARQIISSLSEDYIAVHPFDYEGPTYDYGISGAMNFVYFLVGGFIYIILNLVIKSIIQSRKKDFIIFRSIGASKSDLRKMLSFEQVLYTTFGFVLGFIPLTIMNMVIEEFKVLRYLTVGVYIVVYFIFLAVLLTINNRFANKLFGKSVITTLKSE